MSCSEKKIFIHIGYPKSASTTLQKHLFSKHNQLKTLGVYPTQNIGHDSSEVNLSVPYLKDESLREFYKNITELDDIEYFYSNNKELFKENISHYLNEDDRSVVFSDERLTSVFFSHCDNGVKARRLSELFPNAKIILLVRSQYEWLKSQYRDHPFDPRDLSIGRYVSFDSWFNIVHWNKKIKLLNMLDYYSVIKFYESLFGVNNVGVFVFEELAIELDVFSKKISKFMSIDESETLDILNGVYENLGVSSRYNFFRRLKRDYLPISVSRYVENNFKSYIKSGNKKHYSLSPRNIELLNKYYAEGNKRLVSEYGINLATYKYPGLEW